MAEKSWEQKAAEKRAKCVAAIPNEWKVPASILGELATPWETSRNNLIELDIVRRSGVLTEKELEITEGYNLTTLLKALAAGDLSSAEVTTAYSKRAAIAQQLTGCLTETFFDKALERAKYLDDLKRKGQLAGPFHGLPISLKDSYCLKGIQSTLGMVQNLGHVAEENSAVVDMLLDLGAVLYVKTNVPQTMMTIDSHNNVFGRVLNPLNTMLNAGGSSGGEAALIAFRGSPLGVATDVGGSIRLPALCCGIYGFKPTVNRVPFGRQQSLITPGLVTISPSAGPLAHDMESLKTFMTTIIDARPALFDCTAFDLPWRRPVVPRSSKLRLGLLPEDPLIPIHPPLKAALDEAVRKLTDDGHEILKLGAEQCHITNASEVAWNMFSLDGRPTAMILKGGEPVIPSIKVIATRAQALVGRFVGDMEGLDRLDKLAALNIKARQISTDWQKLWSGKKLDAVIAPGAQSTAVEHDEFGIPPYTVLLNLLDYPACMIPFNKVTKSTASEPYVLKEGQVGPRYNPENLEGAPCAIQVFTGRMRDEECLEISTIIDDCLHRT